MRHVVINRGKAGLLQTLLSFGGGKDHPCGAGTQATQIVRTHWKNISRKDSCRHVNNVKAAH